MIMHHRFILAAKKYAGKIAISDRSLKKTLSYRETLIAALALSAHFSKLPPGYVGVMLPTSAAAFLTCIGLQFSGRVPVMINYSTGSIKNCKLAKSKIGLKNIIASRALLEKLDVEPITEMSFIEDILSGLTAYDKLKATARSLLPATTLIKSLPHADENDDLVILFTSGSEKEPRAVRLTHRNIATNSEDTATVLRLTSDDTILCMLPVFHSFGHMANFWLPLVMGMRAVTYANPLDYKTIPKICREEEVTMIASTPIFFAGYLKESKPGDFKTVKIMVAGADKCPESLRKNYKIKHGITLLEGYGVTETSPVISANTPYANKPGSIGKPWPRIRVKIVDVETNHELLPNCDGKIMVKGDYVMKGYFGDIEETSLRLRNGWYDTGDMGMLDDDGYLWHRGRLQRFTKIGGEMVSLVKAELALEQILPDDISCCVVEVPDIRKGSRLIVALTREIDSVGVLKQLRQVLAPIEVPSSFMVFDELPKMANGKTAFRQITLMVRERLNFIPWILLCLFGVMIEYSKQVLISTCF